MLELLDSLHFDAQSAATFAQEFDQTLDLPAPETIAQAVLLSDWVGTLKPSQRYLLVRNFSIGEWLVQLDAIPAETKPAPAAAATNYDGEEQPDPYADLALKFAPLSPPVPPSPVRVCPLPLKSHRFGHEYAKARPCLNSLPM